ncbi:MAG TPA: cyclic nucleotide-binding domain-containing protein [Thermoflexia bacterium]|nr:cyclic nucleotide-binding domain-containing protein [Thermoflexia bacterium]
MVELDKTMSALGRASLFQSLSKSQLERLAQRFVEREYEAAEAIVSQGKGGEGFFVIVAGEAKVVRETLDGDKVVVNEFAAGDYFGELALLDEGLRTASVITTAPTSCLVLTRWDFLGLLKSDAAIAVAILQELAKRFRLALNAM